MRRERSRFLMRMRRRQAAAVVIQKMWRGFYVRKVETGSNMKLGFVSDRLALVNSRATVYQQLGSRVRRALDGILKEKSINRVLHILCELEVATRMSRECCRIAAGEGVGSVLLELSATLSQSLPDLELNGLIMKILLNLAKDEQAAYSLFAKDNWLEILVAKLVTYDQSKVVFTSRPAMRGEEEEELFMRIGLILIRLSRLDQAAVINALDTDSRKTLAGLVARMERKEEQKTQRFVIAATAAKKDFTELSIFCDGANEDLRRVLLPYWTLQAKSSERINPSFIMRWLKTKLLHSVI